MTSHDAARAYLTARLDQAAAANNAGDERTGDQVIADLIADDNDAARRIIADALLLLKARDGRRTARG